MLSVFGIFYVFIFVQVFIVQGEKSYLNVKGDLNLNKNLEGKKLFVNYKEGENLDKDNYLIECQQFSSIHSEIKNIRVEESSIINELDVQVIIPRNQENKITFKGQVNFNKDLIYSQEQNLDKAQILEQIQVKSNSLEINGIKQWILIDEENFDQKADGNIQGFDQTWKIIQKTNQNQDIILEDQQILQSKIGQAIQKTFTEVQKHEHIKIEGNFYFISPFWNGEQAFIKIDNKIVWMDNHSWDQETIDKFKLNLGENCNNIINSLKDFMWGYPLNVVSKNNQNNFTVQFGVTFDHNSLINVFSQAQIDCFNSLPIFAIDDIEIYIK